MEPLFRKIRSLIAANDTAALAALEIEKPRRFNWTREVFEGIHIKDTPEATALLWTDGKETHRYSFRDMSEAANRLLNFIRGKGVQQQDVMLTQLSGQVINWTGILAAIKGGFRMIPAATILGVQDLVYRFTTLMPSVIISDPDNAPKIEEAERITGHKVPVKILAEGNREGWYSEADLLHESTEAAAADTASDDPLFLFFTSGTTGMPKVVTHTHFSYPFGHLTTASWIGLRQEDTHYNISQPGWAKFAWSSVFAPWNIGAAIFAYHHTGRFHAADTLRLLQQHRITTFCAPPTVLRMLIQEDLTAYRFHMRSCVAAGEPLNPEIIEAWQQGTGLLIRDGFGQTESTCMVANLPGKDVKFGSMGKATFLYDVVIADEEGNSVPDNEEGNICVRMDNGRPNGIFLEYYGDEARKKEVFRHGLYYTGDKAYRDTDGYVWFVGRDDDVIKSSDYRIGPFEVESVLLEHPSVLESAVVGSPHALKGFEVKAFVVLSGRQPAGKETAEELFRFAKEQLAPYKMPRLIEFVEELPKTISGKIRRVELRAAEAVKKARQQHGPHEYAYDKNK